MVCHVLLASHMWPIYLFTPGVMRGSRCVQQPAWVIPYQLQQQFYITSSLLLAWGKQAEPPSLPPTPTPRLPAAYPSSPKGHGTLKARWQYGNSMSSFDPAWQLGARYCIYLWCSSCHVLGVHSPSHQNIFNFLFMPFKSDFCGNYSGGSTAWVLALIGFTTLWEQ